MRCLQLQLLLLLPPRLELLLPPLLLPLLLPLPLLLLLAPTTTITLPLLLPVSEELFNIVPAAVLLSPICKLSTILLSIPSS